MEKNLDITKPRYSKQILPVISRFHSKKLKVFLHSDSLKATRTVKKLPHVRDRNDQAFRKDHINEDG